ncbi:hypothetical protein MRB53_042296 [Persea americana]|nr:hypothetical protein MRB53_042296 [Persea americana]
MSRQSVEVPLRHIGSSSELHDKDYEKNDLNDNESLSSLLQDEFGDDTAPLHSFETTENSSDPKRWTRWKKMTDPQSSSFLLFGMMGEHGIGQEHALMGLSLYVLAFYITTIIAFVIVSFATALSAHVTLGGFLFLRFAQGFVGSPCLANGGASMHDVFTEQELPYALGVWIAFAYAGPALGPAIAAKSYRSARMDLSNVVHCISFSTSCDCFVFLARNISTKDFAQARRRISRVGARDQAEKHDPSHDSVWATLKDSLIKPLQISVLDPSVNFVNLYTSFCYATYYTFFDALPITYMTKYGFSMTQVAQACTCIMIGCAVGAACYFWYVYKYANPASLRGPVPQEERLKPALVAVCLIPIGICIFAYASNGTLHWSIGMGGIALYSGAVYIILQCLSMYTSLFAANDACRSVLAAGAVHFGLPFYTNLGVVWGCTILAAISVLGIFGMFILYYRGAKLRAASKFAVR